jgi:prepilin-type N-terminal cleavage/methylation domain-containing protein
MSMRGDRSGFTMIELLVVSLLGALVIMALYQVLATNERAFAAQRAQVEGQRAVRAGLEILTAELREISPGGGDLVLATPDSAGIRKMKAFGLVCSVNPGGSPPTITVLRVGKWFGTADSIVVFAENDLDTSNDDRWLFGIPSAVDTTATCGTRAAQTLSVPGMSAALGTDTVRAGAPVRAFANQRFGIRPWGSLRYLSRRVGLGTVEPLVGPLRTDGTGLHFEYLDELGDSTAVLTDVAQIRVTLRTQSLVRDSRGQRLADSITARIFPRN